MVFSSILFLYGFLPIVLLLYFIAEKINSIRLKNGVLLFASIVFYAWGGIKYLLLIISLVFINYISGICIEKYKKKKLILILGLAINIADLVYFKYLSFLLSTIDSAVKKWIGCDYTIVIPNIVMPIGISFFTFQIMSYIIDVYRKEVPAQRNLWRLMLYVMMFPQLIAGPIVRYSDVNNRLDNRHTNVEMAEKGIKRFIIGLSKKVFIANAMGSMADTTFSLQGSFNSIYAWVGAISYSLQILYDFSAYSDMAIGLGYVFGFNFNENFNYPYTSTSIQEFWRRWHISLSTWFRDYVYIPLGGNRKGKVRTYINLWIVFILTGIWHGAAWQFLVWGIYHGFFMFIERIGFGRILKKMHRLLAHLYSLIVVIIGWVFFRADNLSIALNYVKNMFSFNFSHFKEASVVANLSSWYIVMFIISCLFSLPISSLVKKIKISQWIKDVCYVVLFALTIIYLAGLSYNPFIYFKF